MSLSGVAKSARGRVVLADGVGTGLVGGVVPWAVGAWQLVSSHDGEEHKDHATDCLFAHPAPGWLYPTFSGVTVTCFGVAFVACLLLLDDTKFSDEEVSDKDKDDPELKVTDDDDDLEGKVPELVSSFESVSLKGAAEVKSDELASLGVEDVVASACVLGKHLESSSVAFNKLCGFAFFVGVRACLVDTFAWAAVDTLFVSEMESRSLES